jgi:hypothetical protein
MFWTVVVLIAVVFVLTYDPRSRTIERFVGHPSAQDSSDAECKHTHLQKIQFGQEGLDCKKNSKTSMGAIIA